jgi:ABC-2 type transport system permease protein
MASPQIGGTPETALAGTAPQTTVTPAFRAPKPAYWLPVATLWWREQVHFYRQRGRMLGALGTPLLFWLMIGAGFGDSFRANGSAGPGAAGYLEYFFPGTILMIVLFTSIFSTMSVIEDRREGFLLSVLVAPIHRSALVLGKVLGGATLALLQGLIMVALAPLLGFRLGVSQILEIAAILFVIAFALTALGFYFAWRLDSVQGFHGVMNLVLMPMWLLSGALFPLTSAHSGIGWVMRANPLTYGLAALRSALYGAPLSGLPAAGVAITVMAVFGVLCLAAGLHQVSRPSAAGSL